MTVPSSRRRTPRNAGIVIDGRRLTLEQVEQVADQVRQHFRVFDSIIPRNVRLSEAPSHGLPALLYDAQSKGAQGYLSLAREIIEPISGPLSPAKAQSRETDKSHAESA